MHDCGIGDVLMLTCLHSGSKPAMPKESPAGGTSSSTGAAISDREPGAASSIGVREICETLNCKYHEPNVVAEVVEREALFGITIISFLLRVDSMAVLVIFTRFYLFIQS